ncbi:MAG: type II/IV secretion system ATPase subunit [Methanomassiliicoccales archaeon]
MSLTPCNEDYEKWHLRRQIQSIALKELRKEVQRRKMYQGKESHEIEQRLLSMAEVVTRYTAGLGLFEILLSDRRLEDIYVDAPCETNPIHVTISGLSKNSSFLRCTTNIIVDEREIRAFVARMKFHSGRAFSQAFPILETDIPGFDSRATVIGSPLSPQGIALALRRHSPEPWTLMRLVNSGMIDCHTAALISFLIDGRSTILICGPRGAGKSTLLGAILFEFPPGQRILTIEDTLELPIRQMQSMGYKVQSLVINNSGQVNLESAAEEALRVSLRMGESAIVLGEVRGREAQVLYDGMRTGKAGSSVLGTIHGESAVSVYERVVHDMGIAPEAFLATDAVLTIGLIRPRGSQKPTRKLIEISEVVRGRPGDFRNIINFHENGCSDILKNGSQLIDKIAQSWNISFQEALENVCARARMREILLNNAIKRSMDFLSPGWTRRANSHLWEGIEKGKDLFEIVQEFEMLVKEGEVQS